MSTYNDTDPLLGSREAPPPDYDSTHAAPQRKPRRLSKEAASLLALLALFFFVTTLTESAYILARPRDILDPASREELRKEWANERETHTREHGQWDLERSQHAQRIVQWEKEQREYAAELAQREVVRKEWRAEAIRHRQEWNAKLEREYEEWQKESTHKRRALQAELDQRRRDVTDEIAHTRKQWEAEKTRHEEEDRRWDQERWERMRLYWGDLWRNGRCHSYGTREYSARLWNIAPGADGIQACQRTPVVINDRTLPSPTSCEDRDRDGIHGHWLVDFGETACQPYWGQLYDKGCVAQGSRMHRAEARLENIQSGDDWQVMCDTTPNVVHGIPFDRPKSCENRGMWSGMVGIWEYHDPQC